jgi:phage terminase, large subunit, PBSX family|nr:MAG TPA: large terminase [Caudoviricetes sp.]
MGFSEKQREIMRFPYRTQYEALICDGAVRSGKTSVMSLSFFLWAMGNFDGQAFALCGKSVGAVERNIVTPLMAITYLQQNFSVRYNRADHVIVATRGRKENRFYLFGGKDESSASLIQGITLAGVLLDEVALMPRSFVEQALARCSVAGAKLWFNCNPEGPEHWFRKEWILKTEKHKALHLHFTMDDNPALDDATRERYRTMYSGVFYERFVLGNWVMSEGLVYDMFDTTANEYRPENMPPSLHSSGVRTIACDYGTSNPTVFLDIYDYNDKIYVDREYRWDSRDPENGGRQKTDEEYADDMQEFMGPNQCTIIVDPSAASFIAALRRRGLYVLAADNDVLDGIRKTSSLIKQRRLLVNTQCSPLLGEIGTYLWDKKNGPNGEDRVIKERDHGPDALRYFVNSLAEWRI